MPKKTKGNFDKIHLQMFSEDFDHLENRELTLECIYLVLYLLNPPKLIKNTYLFKEKQKKRTNFKRHWRLQISLFLYLNAGCF